MPPPAATRWRTHRRGRARKAPAFDVSERDWAELPADVILCVLHKLDQVDLLLGGVAGLCRSWRCAAREEPELWRHIDVRYLPAATPFTRHRHATLANIMRAALRLSAGQCHTFAGDLLDEDLLLFLANKAPSLKRLQLINCYRISNGGFANAIRKFHLIEEIQLVNCSYDAQVLDVVAKACRRLEHLTLVQQIYHSYRNDGNRKAFAIARMHGLRSLVLDNDDLGNEGLTAIIHNCPRLEYLKMRDCRYIDMDCDLTTKCTRIIDMDYYEYSTPSKPCSCCITSLINWYNDPCDYSDYDHNCYLDLFLYSYLGDDIDGADFDDYEKLLDIKSMRRYLS